LPNVPAFLPALCVIGPILAKVLPDEGQRLQVQLQPALIDQLADLGRAMAEVMKADSGS
jgi:hypothetical protein